MYFSITISNITLLPIDNPHAVAADIGIAINPIPVTDRMIELDVVAIITNVSNDLDIVVNNLYFLFINFVFEVSIHFFNVVNSVIETINTIQFLL